MITKVSLSDRALEDLTLKAGPFAKNIHKALIETILKFGIIQISSNADASSLRESISNQPEPIKKMWEVALSSLHSKKRLHMRDPQSGKGIDSIDDVSSMREILASHVNIFAVHDDLAKALGIPEDGNFVDSVSSIELTNIADLSESNTINHLRDLASRGQFPQGVTRKHVWESILEHPARISTHVVVCDRYFLQRLLKHGGGTVAEHAVWLVSQLDSCMPSGSKISILTSNELDNNEVSISEVQAAFSRRWTPSARGNVKSVEITMAPWKQGRRRLPHDRHIWFNCGMGLISTQGFDRLANVSIDDSHGFKWELKTGDSGLNVMVEEQRAVTDPQNIRMSSFFILQR